MTQILTQWSQINITVCHPFRQSSQKSKQPFKTSTENPAQPVCRNKLEANLTITANKILTILLTVKWANQLATILIPCQSSEVILMGLYLGKFLELIHICKDLFFRLCCHSGT